MADRVNPNVARQGEFIDSFPYGDKATMLRSVDNMEWIMRRLHVNGYIVYTFIVPWGKPDSFGTWQIYLFRS
jgi:hypothetical protein